MNGMNSTPGNQFPDRIIFRGRDAIFLTVDDKGIPIYLAEERVSSGD